MPGDGAKELELVKRASAGVWVVSPRLEQLSSNTYLLRIVAVAPKSSMLLVRFEKVDGARLATRAVVMLRDITTGRAGPPPETPCADEVVARRDESGRSKGRPVLAVSTSLFGLYAAFSVYRSAGTDDPRLLYPLLALGSGVGLGASLLVSEEFDVTPGISWTLVGGTWWGVIAGSNIAAGRNVQPVDDRYAYGLAGGLIGTTLAVVALASTRYDDGDAALVHSGGAIGTFGGGVIDYLVRGDLKGEGPSTGLGYGAGIGVVAGGLLGGLFTVSAQRVLMIDLGAGLGALAGASAASPLVVVKDASPTKTRWFLGAVLSGTVLGGTIAWVATRDRTAPEAEKKASARITPRITPSAGVLGASFDPKTGRTAPIFGAGLSGVF